MDICCRTSMINKRRDIRTDDAEEIKTHADDRQRTSRRNDFYNKKGANDQSH